MELHGNARGFQLRHKILLFRRAEAAIRINGKDERGNSCAAEAFQSGFKRSVRSVVADVELRPHVRNADVGVRVKAFRKLGPLMQHVALCAAGGRHPCEQSGLAPHFLSGALFQAFLVYERLVADDARERQPLFGGRSLVIVAPAEIRIKLDGQDLFKQGQTARLEFAQLHGAQSLDCARRIGPEKVIRVLWPDRYESLDALQKEMELWADSCAWFLLDAGSQGGGHGVSLDWNALASLKSPRPWFLAGGLSSASLNKALEQCTPNGIDLNSGVEAIPGQKSPQKLLAALKSLISYTPYHIA